MTTAYLVVSGSNWGNDCRLYAVFTTKELAESFVLGHKHGCPDMHIVAAKTNARIKPGVF